VHIGLCLEYICIGLDGVSALGDEADRVLLDPRRGKGSAVFASNALLTAITGKYAFELSAVSPSENFAVSPAAPKNHFKARCCSY
jgi:hypothetical protein